MINTVASDIDRISTCVGACAAAAVLSAAGLPPIDLGAGFAGSMLSLGFIKPVHWGTWLDGKESAKNQYQAVYYWARRIVLVAFIVTASAVAMTALAQALPHVPKLGWTGNIASPIRSLLGGFAGLSLIPIFVKLWEFYLKRKAEQ